MGDEDIHEDSIWTVPRGPHSSSAPGSAATDGSGADGALPASSYGPESDEEIDALWGTIDRRSDQSRRAGRVRIALGVTCLAIAVLAAFLVMTGNGDGEEGVAADDVTTTTSGSTVLSSQEEPSDLATAGLVPSTVPEGAVVKCGDWDNAVNFAPAEMTDGVYIWSDFDGWHVRAAGNRVGEVTGKITGTVRPNLLAPTDPQRVDASTPEGGTDLFFTIRPGDEAGGFDFTAGCTQRALTIELKSDAAPIDPALVHLGTKASIDRNPFMVSRTPEPG